MCIVSSNTQCAYIVLLRPKSYGKYVPVGPLLSIEYGGESLRPSEAVCIWRCRE